jgi:hypothetical protein
MKRTQDADFEQCPRLQMKVCESVVAASLVAYQAVCPRAEALKLVVIPNSLITQTRRHGTGYLNQTGVREYCVIGGCDTPERIKANIGSRRQREKTSNVEAIRG